MMYVLAIFLLLEVLAQYALAALALAEGNKLSYEDALDLSIKTKKPIVVWVNQEVQKVGDYVVVGVESFPQVPGAGVIVGVPRGTYVERILDFDGYRKAQDIFEASLRHIHHKEIKEGDSISVKPIMASPC